MSNLKYDLPEKESIKIPYKYTLQGMADYRKSQPMPIRELVEKAFEESRKQLAEKKLQQSEANH